MNDDTIRITIDLECREGGKIWAGRASIHPGSAGEEPHPTKPKITIQKMDSLASGEEYSSGKEAYQAILAKALARIRENWPNVPNEKIQVTVRKQIDGKTLLVNPEELEEDR